TIPRPMSEQHSPIYEFGDFQLDLGRQALLRDGEEVTLTPKVYSLLVIFVENPGRLLSKDELIKLLWEDSFVEEANLNVNVSALRRALGEKPNDDRYVVTVPRRGYRFVADVRTAATAPPAEEVRSVAEIEPDRRSGSRFFTPAIVVVVFLIIATG